MRRRASLALAISIAAATLVTAATADEAMLYRPMLADLNESVARGGVFSVEQDLRYGTDILDSTSTGGWLEDQRGVGWNVSAGRIFRAPAWERALGWRGPWRRYQLTASGLIRSSFERFQAQHINVNDYQFGAGAEAQWTGAWVEPRRSGAFDRPVVTTRTAFYHRSAHTGDEYIAQGRFGNNQNGPGLLPRPPVRRLKLSYEVVQQWIALEWSPNRGGSSWRGYAGGEWKLGTMGREPWNLRSPAAQVGLEFRSAGNRDALGGDPLSAMLGRIVGRDRLGFTWLAAVDLRLARPFDFASVDNPNGDGEVWTPHLWSEGTFGREFRRYAGSWHGMVGLSLWNRERRTVSQGGALVGPETAITLEWSRGYSARGTFLDQRREEHPRWYVVPAITTTF